MSTLSIANVGWNRKRDGGFCFWRENVKVFAAIPWRLAESSRVNSPKSARSLGFAATGLGPEQFFDAKSLNAATHALKCVDRLVTWHVRSHWRF